MNFVAIRQILILSKSGIEELTLGNRQGVCGTVVSSSLRASNSDAVTGEVVGLFAKDEKDAMCGDVRNDFVKDNPNMEERGAPIQKANMDHLRILQPKKG